MFLSVLASLRYDPVPRAYYQRKRQHTKRRNQAVHALGVFGQEVGGTGC